jgi:hypothetical protein
LQSLRLNACSSLLIMLACYGCKRPFVYPFQLGKHLRERPKCKEKHWAVQLQLDTGEIQHRTVPGVQKRARPDVQEAGPPGEENHWLPPADLYSFDEEEEVEEDDAEEDGGPIGSLEDRQAHLNQLLSDLILKGNNGQGHNASDQERLLHLLEQCRLVRCACQLPMHADCYYYCMHASAAATGSGGQLHTLMHPVPLRIACSMRLSPLSRIPKRLRRA